MHYWDGYYDGKDIRTKDIQRWLKQESTATMVAEKLGSPTISAMPLVLRAVLEVVAQAVEAEFG